MEILRSDYIRRELEISNYHGQEITDEAKDFLQCNLCSCPISVKATCYI